MSSYLGGTIPGNVGRDTIMQHCSLNKAGMRRWHLAQMFCTLPKLVEEILRHRYDCLVLVSNFWKQSKIFFLNDKLNRKKKQLILLTSLHEKKARGVLPPQHWLVLDVKALIQHGRPMASIYKTYLQREGYIYKYNLHFEGFTNPCMCPPWLPSLQARFSPELSIFPTHRSKVYSYAAQKKKKSVKAGLALLYCSKSTCKIKLNLHTMKEFWFLSFSSSLICCLKNSILCSRKVAWISHTRTKDLKFFNSVQISDMWMLPMLWASSRNLDACFSACSAGQPCTCFIRFSLK